MAYTWVKIYVEFIHDPKIGRLSRDLRLFVIELILLAGENGKDGILPPIEDIYRSIYKEIPKKKIVEYFETLAEAGILREQDGEWVVTNFSKRQAALSSAERVKKFREGVTKSYKNGNEACNEDVTKTLQKRYMNRNETVTEEEEEVEEEKEGELRAGELAKIDKNPPAPAAPSFSTISSATGMAQFGAQIHQRSAGTILMGISKLASIPSTEYAKLDIVTSMLQQYGEDRTVAALTTARDKWTSTQGKTGKMYSPLNFGWVDWALGILSGDGIGEKRQPVDPFASLNAYVDRQKAV